MKKSVLLRDELAKRTDVSGPVMDEIEKLKLVKPLGVADDKAPFYSEEAVEQVNYIKKMTDLGYSVDEIQKVIKKVGFPKSVVPSGGVEKTGKHLTIGDLASKVGVSARTLKHWEEKGIIEADMRSSGGFRLYSEAYVYLCDLIKDLQHFGYSLEQIKEISDQFRDFLVIEKNIEIYPAKTTCKKLDEMSDEISSLKDRMKLLKKGIGRWEELVNKKAKEIAALKKKNEKRNKEKQTQQKDKKRRQESGVRSQKKNEARNSKSESRNKSK
ncbi:MAG: MerR family transcriptional regulator [Acidobacteriota bacterium]